MRWLSSSLPLLLLLCIPTAHGQSSQTIPTECLPPTPTNQIAPVASPNKADIIFVLDTSSSMGAETNYVMSNLNAFGQHLEDEGIDYHVVLVGQTQSCCDICVNPPLASVACGDTGERYRRVDQLILSVDACSRMAETEVYAQYTQFLRPDAAKTIVFISDDGITDTEYDGSTNPGEYGCVAESCKTIKGNKWLNDLQSLDVVKQQFVPTDKLPKGVMVHTIDAHECPGESGYQRSFVYRALTSLTGGTNFKLCEADWTPYFSTIAGAVVDTAVQAKCMHDVPRSSTDAALLFGNLEPDTPFSLRFVHEKDDGSGGELTLTKSITNTCFEPGCSYVASPCVCAMRCPVGYARAANDASQCTKQGQPTCSLAYCDTTTVDDGGVPKCALTSQERMFTVDDPSDPRAITLCSHACEVIRSFSRGGNISFAFHPVAKLRSMTVGGRGGLASASFGPAKTLHPAHAFPTGHPATSRTDCGGAPSRPTIPDKGPGLFSGGVCPVSSGTEMFYALDPSTGRSRTFATGAGLMIFFLVNAVGESFLGIQIGHYPTVGATGVSRGYGVIDVILSGRTIDEMTPMPSWVVQDGAGGSDFGSPTDMAKNKAGRILVSTLQGKTAGGILGPLPAYEFCVDLIIVEASGSVSSVSIVNFDTATSTPSQPDQFVLSGDFLDEGGLRFCADACDGTTLTANVSDYTVECYTTKQGRTFCPSRGDPDTNQATSGSLPTTNNGGNNSPSSLRENSTTNSDGNNPGRNNKEKKNQETMTMATVGVIIVSAMVCCTCCVVVAVVVAARKKHQRPSTKQPVGAVGAGGGGEVELVNGKKRQTLSTTSLCNSAWSLVLDPESGDQYWYNCESGATQWEEPEAIQQALTRSRKSLGVEAGEGGPGSASVSSVSSVSSTTSRWYPFQTVDGHEAFANSNTGEVAWEIPSGGVEGIDTWSEWVNPDGGEVYFSNDRTGEVSWTDPRLQGDEQGTAAAAAAAATEMMSNPMAAKQNGGHYKSETRWDLDL